jgi:hypothetical protein
LDRRLDALLLQFGRGNRGFSLLDLVLRFRLLLLVIFITFALAVLTLLTAFTFFTFFIFTLSVHLRSRLTGSCKVQAFHEVAQGLL